MGAFVPGGTSSAGLVSILLGLLVACGPHGVEGLDAGVEDLTGDAGLPRAPDAVLRWATSFGSEHESEHRDARFDEGIESIRRVAVGGDGTIHAVASLHGPAFGDHSDTIEADHGVYLRFSSEGILQSATPFVPVEGGYTRVLDVSLDEGGGAYLCGEYERGFTVATSSAAQASSLASSGDGFVARFAPDGSLQWLRVESSWGESAIMSCRAHARGGVVLVTRSTGLEVRVAGEVVEDRGCCLDGARVLWMSDAGVLEYVGDSLARVGADGSQIGQFWPTGLVRARDGGALLSAFVVSGTHLVREADAEVDTIRVLVRYGREGGVRWVQRLEGELFDLGDAEERENGNWFVAARSRAGFEIGGIRMPGGWTLLELSEAGEPVRAAALPHGVEPLSFFERDDAITVCGNVNEVLLEGEEVRESFGTVWTQSVRRWFSADPQAVVPDGLLARAEIDDCAALPDGGVVLAGAFPRDVRAEWRGAEEEELGWRARGDEDPFLLVTE